MDISLPQTSLIGYGENSVETLVTTDDTGGATPVNRRSDQFQEVHYKLEMALAHADVKVTHLQVWDVRNPALVAKFDQHLRRCPGQPPVESWVDVDGLDAHNSEEQISKRGFQLRSGETSMNFSTGIINIAKPPEDGRSSGLNRFLLAEVCTGRSYPKVDPNGKNVVPPGYDSLYLYDNETTEKGNGDDNNNNSSSKTDYAHEYVLTNMTQVSPQFVIHFTVAAVTDSDRARNAKAKEAHHNSQGTDVMGDILDLLDRKLHWSQESVRNKFHAINALQSELSQASHEYNKSLDASHQQDERLQACRAQLASRRSVINDKLKEVQSNSALVEEQLYTMLQDALFQLQDETQRKLNVLLGEELEIRRRVAHIDWSEDCLARFRSELGPPDFVHAWRNHRQIRKNLYRYRDIGGSVLDQVYADIRVAGGVQIVTEHGPTNVLIGNNGGKGGNNDNNGVDGTMMNEFRQEVFKTSSPTKSGRGTQGYSNNDNMMVGTNSLASSIRTEIHSGTSKQAPNVYASSPTVASLGLPSATLRPATLNPYDQNALKDDNTAFSSSEAIQSEWSQVMRKDWGLPEPPAPTNNSPSKLLDASSGPGSSSSSSSSSNTPSFSAVDAFVSQTTGGGDPNNVANAGDFKDNDHPDGLENGNNNNSSAPAPPSGFPGMVVPPPPTPSMEPQGDRTRPEGIIGQYWDRYSMTSTKLRMQRKGNTDTLPLFQSAIIQSSADKLLVQMSLPSPASMMLENLNIDPSLRNVEDIQTSIMEKLQDLNMAEAEDGEPEIGLMFVFKSKDYIFGSFVEKKFKFHLAETDMPAEVIGSHYGSKNNHMFSVTHDLKVSLLGCCWLLLLLVAVFRNKSNLTHFFYAPFFLGL